MASRERHGVSGETPEPRNKIHSKSSVNVRCQRNKFSYKNLFSGGLRKKTVPGTIIPKQVRVNEDVSKKCATYKKEQDKQQKLDRERRGQLSIKYCNKTKKPEYKHEPAKSSNRIIKKCQGIDNISPILIDSNVLQNALKSCKEHRHDLASGSPLKIPCRVMLDKFSCNKGEFDGRMPTLIISPTPVNSTMINEALKEAGLSKGDKSGGTFGIAVEPPIDTKPKLDECNTSSRLNRRHTFMFSPNKKGKGICIQRGKNKDDKPIQIFPATLTLVESGEAKVPTLQQLYPIMENSQRNFPSPTESPSSKNGPPTQLPKLDKAKEPEENWSWGSFAKVGKSTPDDTPSENTSKLRPSSSSASEPQEKSLVPPTPSIEAPSLPLLHEEQNKQGTEMKQQDQQKFTQTHTLVDERYTLINELFFSKPFTSTESSTAPEKTNPLTYKVGIPIEGENRNLMMNFFVKDDSCNGGKDNSTSDRKSDAFRSFIMETPDMVALSESDPMLARVLARFKKCRLGENKHSSHSNTLLDQSDQEQKMSCPEISSQHIHERNSMSSTIETSEQGIHRTRQSRDGKVFLEQNGHIYNRFYSYLQEVKTKKDNTNVSLGLFGVNFRTNSDNDLQQIENEGDYDNPDYITNQRLTVPRHRYSMQTMSESSKAEGIENDKLMTSRTYSFIPSQQPFLPTYSLNYKSKYDKVPCYNSQEQEYGSSNTRTVYKINIKPLSRREEIRGEVQGINKWVPIDVKGIENTENETRSVYKINLSPSPVSMKEAIEAQTTEILKCIYHMGKNKPATNTVRKMNSTNKFTLSVNQGPWSKNTLDMIRKYEDEHQPQETAAEPAATVNHTHNQEEGVQSTRMTLSESTALGQARDRSRQSILREMVINGLKEQKSRSSMMCPDTVCEALLSSMTMLSHFDKKHASVPFMVVNTTSSVTVNINPADVVRDACKIVAFFHVIEKMDCGPFVLMVSVCSEMQESLLAWLWELHGNSISSVKILTPDTRSSNHPTAVSYTGPTISPRDVQGLAEVVNTGCYVTVNRNLLKRMLGKNGDLEIMTAILG